MSQELPAAWLADEAERAVLGAIILDPGSMERLILRISKRDFHDQSLGQLFDFMCDMHTLGEPIGDIAYLTGRLAETKMWADIGKQAGIGKLAVDCPSAAHAQFYAAQVREAADRRRLAELSAKFYENLMDPMVKPGDAIKLLEAKIATTGYKAGAEAILIAEASKSAVDKSRNRDKAKYAVGVQTGLYGIDGASGGLFPGELTVLAARPSIGKSALGAQIAYHAAMQGRPSLFVSMEMAEWEIASRALAAESTVDSRAIRAASLTDEQITELEAVIQQQENVPFWIWRPRSPSVPEIRAKAREIAAVRGLALLVVDYLSLVRPEDSRAFRRDQLSQIGKDLKDLADELKVPVLALAQLNRSSEGEKPKLSHLAESGTIEQDANAVWLLHRENRAATEAILMIEKNRSGPTFDVMLEFDPIRTTFRDSMGDFA
jgi:replicative DNA helicase